MLLLHAPRALPTSAYADVRSDGSPEGQSDWLGTLDTKVFKGATRAIRSFGFEASLDRSHWPSSTELAHEAVLGIEPQRMVRPDLVACKQLQASPSASALSFKWT